MSGLAFSIPKLVVASAISSASSSSDKIAFSPSRLAVSDRRRTQTPFGAILGVNCDDASLPHGRATHGDGRNRDATSRNAATYNASWAKCLGPGYSISCAATVAPSSQHASKSALVGFSETTTSAAARDQPRPVVIESSAR